jgi:hypothetical protein
MVTRGGVWDAKLGYDFETSEINRIPESNSKVF